MRRMFSKRIISSGRFLKMPPSAQALYFHLAINADDDGVVEAHLIIKITDSKEDDYSILKIKRFIYQLNEDLVVVIVDWREHNLIRPDRKIDSIYKDVLKEKMPDIKLIEPQIRADRIIKNNGTSNGQPMVSIGKDRIGEDSIDITDQFETFWKLYPRKIGKKTALTKWKKIKPDEQLNTTILEALKKYCKVDQWTKDNGAFIPHPSTWLNQERWNDEIKINTINNKSKFEVEHKSVSREELEEQYG